MIENNSFGVDTIGWNSIVKKKKSYQRMTIAKAQKTQ